MLLNEPNPASPANGEAAELFVKNKREYNRRVKEVVDQSILEIGDDEEEDDE